MIHKYFFILSLFLTNLFYAADAWQYPTVFPDTIEELKTLQLRLSSEKVAIVGRLENALSKMGIKSGCISPMKPEHAPHAILMQYLLTMGTENGGYSDLCMCALRGHTGAIEAQIKRYNIIMSKELSARSTHETCFLDWFMLALVILQKQD